MADASIISSTTVLRGHITGEGGLRVEGRIRGEVTVEGDVTVGSEAEIAGNVSGHSLSIAGRVQGDLRGRDAVMLQNTAQVVGDIEAPTIGIAEGALVRGRIATQGTSASGSDRAVAARDDRHRPQVTSRARPNVNRPAPPPARSRVTLAERETASRDTNPRQSARNETADVERVNERTSTERGNAPAREKKAPPAPVISAPRRGAKGRKKVSKRR